MSPTFRSFHREAVSGRFALADGRSSATLGEADAQPLPIGLLLPDLAD
jgi:hypothetical protein